MRRAAHELAIPALVALAFFATDTVFGRGVAVGCAAGVLVACIIFLWIEGRDQ